MYKAPIDIIYGEMSTKIEGDILKAVQRYGINVDKEELIRALEYDRGQYKKGYRDGKADAVQEWIPVTERLPEHDGRYIVTACDEGCSCGDGIWYDTVVVEAEYYKGEWSWNENGTEYDITCFVTHFMKMPDPPKGE